MIVKTLALFTLTAVAEILGRYLPYLWLRRDAFAWLLTLHPGLGAGRAYAAYGGFYVAVAVLWMWQVESVRPDRWDLIGVAVTLLGTAIIAFAPRAGPAI